MPGMAGSNWMFYNQFRRTHHIHMGQGDMHIRKLRRIKGWLVEWNNEGGLKFPADI